MDAPPYPHAPQHPSPDPAPYQPAPAPPYPNPTPHAAQYPNPQAAPPPAPTPAQHPHPTQAPQYPAPASAPQAPQHPNATAQAPPYPQHPNPTEYPNPTPQAPQYPTSAQQAPQYPAPAQQAPQYPAPTPQAPQYPTPVPQAAPSPAPHSPQHPHHIDTDHHGRVHISGQQRHTDATAFGNLLLYLPNFLCSLFVVGLVSAFFGSLGIVVVLAWLASGALMFHRPTERALARHLLRLRYPTPQERAKLEPVWREVTSRAGIDGHTYELWIEDSDSLNAVAAAGHIVGVTRFALHQLPNGELAAVMAHELGHHVGGHAWSSLLGYWYALPGRFAWQLVRVVTAFMFQLSRVFSCFGVVFFCLVVGGITLASLSTLYGLPLLFLGLPYALAAVGRRAELRADQHAAALGFAPMLAAVLEKMHQAEQYEQQQAAMIAAAAGNSPATETPASRLLASHPDYHTRLHHLQPYLQPAR
ncbi:M48 family metalloprotease [Streptomyces sp. NPDC086080]|uniref:M48 family metalloprotease n=1 Tax=Streptomyces sp. NPDC086080 TaxID=3365748 RepID=UPI0037CE3B0A